MNNKIYSTFFGVVTLAFLSFSAVAAHFGVAFPKGDAISIAEAAKHVSDYTGAEHLFTGRITQVCQKEGCWLVIEDDGVAARVMVKDHAFAVPKDASGQVVVYGVLSEVKMSQEAAEHMAKDAGEVAANKSKPMSHNEIRILATGIDIAD